MNSRIFKGALAVLTLAMLVMAATTAFAAVMSVSATAPTVDGSDIANLVTGTNWDKWWAEAGGGAGSAKGQSFLTGSDPVLLTSITYQIETNSKAMPTKTYTVRVGALSGTTISPFHSETATQDFNWNTTDGTTVNGEEYMTWTLDSPVFLSPNSLYGIDIGLNSSTSNWQSGIPYIQYVRTNTYADGQRYTTGDGWGVGDSEAHLAGNDDRVFHLNLSTGPQAAYWDINGAAGGAGGATPTGTWDASANWNPAADGTGATAAWAAGQKAVFAAGGHATGAYTVTVAGTQDIGGLKFEEGTVTISGGTALRMATTTVMDVASGLTSTIATTISEDIAGRQLIKTGDGTLVLSGANTYTGPTTVLVGTLQVGAAGALPAVTDVTVGDLSGVESSTLDLDGNSVTVGTLTLVDNSTVDTSGAATLTTSALTYNAGTLTLGSTALNADSLTANADLDVSSSTVSAPTAVTVNNSTLTVGHDIATQTLTLDGASIVGGGATAVTKYSLANIADYSADITGAAADLVIGEGAAADQKVKISGTGNTYGGITRLDSGYLEVDPDAANLGDGQLVFNGGSLQTSGTFTGQLGAANDIMQQVAALKFAATDAPLTVTVERADGTTDPLQFSYGSNTENGTSSITLGSPTSDAMVEITNDLFAGHGADGGGGQSYHVKLGTVDNPNSSNDIGLASGDITNPPTENQVSLEKSGTGTLWLTGTNTGFSRTTIGGGNQSVLRAVDGVGLPPTSLLQISQGVLESSGTFTREFGTAAGNGVDPGKIDFNKEAGFSAYGGPLTVSLKPAGGAVGDPLTWQNRTLGFNSKSLYMGSPTADNVVTVTNDINGNGYGVNFNPTIYVSGNPDSDADYVVFSGDIANIRQISNTGTANPGEVRYDGDVTVQYDFAAKDGAIVRINGTLTSLANYGPRVTNGGTIGGSGTIVGKLDVYTTGIVAPGNSVGTMNVTGNAILANGSIYEWEVGQLGETDVLNITAGTLDLEDFVLKILDDDGYVENDTDQLPVFTYAVGSVTVNNGFADNFDTSALDGTWTVGALSLTDDTTGTIYLTGLSGGTPSFMTWDGGAFDWNSEHWSDGQLPSANTAMIIDADTNDSVVTVDADFTTAVGGGPAASVAVGENHTASLIVDNGSTLEVTGEVAVGNSGTLQVDGRLDAAMVTSHGTLSGGDTIVGEVWADGIVAPGSGTAKSGIGTLTFDTGDPTEKWVEFGPAAEVNMDIGVTNDVIVMQKGKLDLGGSQLNLNVVGDILPAAAKRSYGAKTVNIVSTTENSEIDDVFNTALLPGDHLDRGIFVDVEGNGVVTTTISVKVDLYQAQKGDANGDHVIDTGDMMLVFGNWTLLPPPDHVPRDWPEGNFSFFPPEDANTTIETGDMMEVFGNWTLKDAGDAKDGDPQIADLLYYPATGEVELDPSEAAGEVITIFRLMNEAGDPDFNAPGVANFPWPLPDFLAVDTPLEIANTDLSGIGISDVWSLGAIFPTGLDQDQLEAFLTVATYVGSRGTGVHRLDLIVIPEPGTVVMLLTGALGLLLLALRRRSA